MKLSKDAELLLMRLLNAIDKLPLHTVPLQDWNGIPFDSDVYEDYPNPLDLENSPGIILGKSIGGTTSVVPTAILSEIFRILAGDGENPGLEDFISGDWRERDETS